MSQEIRLAPDGERAVQEAQNYCFRANVSIVAAEHLLAGALAVLAAEGKPGIPAREAVEAALMLAQGTGDVMPDNQVMFGSAARDAINATARTVAEAGQSTIDAATLALGTIDSGEVNPMFYSSLGTTRTELRAAVAG